MSSAGAASGWGIFEEGRPDRNRAILDAESVPGGDQSVVALVDEDVGDILGRPRLALGGRQHQDGIRVDIGQVAACPNNLAGDVCRGQR